MYRSTHYRLLQWLACFVVGVAGILAGAARGQDVVHPCQTRDFRIPYSIDNNGQGLSALYLFVSKDRGGTYEYVAPPASPLTPPNLRFFVFHAPADGEYWFVVQTRDTAGVLQPVNPRLVQPSLKVHVDTVKPRILSFNQVSPQDGSRAAVKWVVEDDHFASVSLDYRAQGTEQWYPVPSPVQSANATQGFSPVIEGPLDVRLRVQDKGGNVDERVTTVTVAAGHQTAQTPGQAAPADNGPRIMHVSRKTFQLDYSFDEASVGPSGIKHVEIWSTHDGAHSWQLAPKTAPFKGPQEFRVASPGRWGFILVPVSGVGLRGEKPRAGDVPQLWVEVDESKPMVTLMGAPVVGTGPDAGFLIINWKASDTNLRREGITISYRAKPEDPWTPFEHGERLPGTTTTFRAPTQGLPYQFYIQVKAIDEAGNEGEAVTEQPIKVDLTVPRIKNLVVQPATTGGERGSPYSPDH
jgi:hypothetical protein